jgi:hypothetical protein
MRVKEGCEELFQELGEALEHVDSAIAIRDLEHIGNMKDLDLIRAEIHALTCRLTGQ